jgi:hypothetical protein
VGWVLNALCPTTPPSAATTPVLIATARISVRTRFIFASFGVVL